VSPPAATATRGRRSTAALGGNWQGIWVAFFSIGKIIFHLVKPTAPAELK
jgi:hypothetical protein